MNEFSLRFGFVKRKHTASEPSRGKLVRVSHFLLSDTLPYVHREGYKAMKERAYTAAYWPRPELKWPDDKPSKQDGASFWRCNTRPSREVTMPFAQKGNLSRVGSKSFHRTFFPFFQPHRKWCRNKFSGRKISEEISWENGGKKLSIMWAWHNFDALFHAWLLVLTWREEKKNRSVRGRRKWARVTWKTWKKRLLQRKTRSSNIPENMHLAKSSRTEKLSKVHCVCFCI